MKTVAVIALASLLVACGGGDDDSDDGAARFAVSTTEQARKGQSGQRYDDLHPAQQRVVDRDLFMECTADDFFPAENIEATDTYEEAITIAEAGAVMTTAVTIEYDIGDRSDAFTMHVQNLDGHWKWFLATQDVEAFQAGECP